MEVQPTIFMLPMALLLAFALFTVCLALDLLRRGVFHLLRSLFRNARRKMKNFRTE